MRPSPTLPPALRRGLFLGSVAVRDGLLTDAQLRSRSVQRVMRDVYADAHLVVDHGVRIAAAVLVMPELVAIAGRSAAWLHGVRLVGAMDRVEVVAEEVVRRHSRAGLMVHTGVLPATDVEQIGHYRVTTAPRTCIDATRWYDEETAVTYVDAMLAGRLVSPADLNRQLADSTGKGLLRAERRLALMDGRAESPPESVLRLRVIRAGLPSPEPQVEVWHNGVFVARADLGWRAAKVALEYDGAWHGAPGQLTRDRKRLNALVAAGWTVIFVTAADMRDLSGILVQVKRALRSADSQAAFSGKTSL